MQNRLETYSVAPTPETDSRYMRELRAKVMCCDTFTELERADIIRALLRCSRGENAAALTLFVAVSGRGAEA